MKHYSWFLIGVATAIAVAGSSIEAQSAGRYNVTDLGAVLGTNSYAHGINNNGQVVGYWNTGTNGIHAFLYDQGTVTDLGALGGTNSYAISINSLGHVVGFSTVSNSIQAFIYNGGLTNLGNWGGDNSYAESINTAGKIVGYIDTTNGARAIIFDNGSVTNLGTLGGTNSYAFGINTFNQVAGASLIAGDTAMNAFIWQENSFVNLNTLVPTNSGWQLTDARGINDGAYIVGWGVTNGEERAFLYDGGVVDLGVLPGGTNSFALALNNSNHVVGASSVSNGFPHAFLWQNGMLKDLNDLLPPGSGWDLREARGINDGGKIVGWGVLNGTVQAFLLTPNAPPSVSITGPTNNSTFTAMASIPITADAFDEDGTIAKVEFFANGFKVGEDDSDPFSFDWNSVTVGQYTLTAVATDSAGSTATSAVVNVSVDLPSAANLRLWLKADALTGLTNGATIQTWTDSSGLGNNATQSTAANRPTYLTGALSGLPVVRFDGTNDQFGFQNNPFLGATQGEMFVVVKARIDAPAGFNRGLAYFGNNYTYYPLASGQIQDQFGSTTAKTVGDPAQPLDQFNLYNAGSASGEWVARLNGVLQHRTTNNTVAFPAVPILGSANGGSFFDGDVAELLIYNRMLSAEEREAVGGYLSGKYALMAAPAAPASLIAKAISSNQVSLAWSAALTNDLTQFIIERKEGAGGTYAVLAQIENGASSIDGTAIVGTPYFYRVKARTYGGDSGYSNDAQATTSPGQASLPAGDLTLWLKADAGRGFGGLGEWRDQSGMGNNAVQAVTASRPQAIEAALNGRPTVRFDGTNDVLNLPNLMAAAAEGEVFVVLKSAVTSGPRALWRFGYGGTIPRYPETDGTVSDNFGSSSTAVNFGPPLTPLDQFQIYNISSRAGEWAARFNGLLRYTRTNNTVQFNTAPRIGLGFYQGAEYFAGDIAEILIFSRATAANERSTVEIYLNQKFGLVSSAPLAPTNLTATAVSPTQINLAWSNATLAANLEIERKASPAGVYSKIASLSAGVTSYSDTGIPSGQEYFYRLRASNLGGVSPYSVEASAIANTTPSVVFTSPTNGAMFVRPVDIALTASASDIDGAIAKVEFFYGGTTKIGEDTSAPYSAIWTNPPGGSYVLTAKATDNLGGTATSSPPVSITVSNPPPAIVLAAPAGGSIYQAPATIELTATASDADGSVTNVEFFYGSTKIGEDASSPFTLTWSDVIAGTYSLTAVAKDDGGASATSVPVSVTVNAAPAISITSPTNNETFAAPANVTIAASATDTDGMISRVDFYEGLNFVGSDSSSPYSLAWNNVPAGTYMLTAVALDNAGGGGTSAPVRIEVRTNLVAVADSHARAGTSAANNFGTSTNVEVQTSSANNTRVGYFKFTIPAGLSNISGVKFRFNAKLSAAGTNSARVHATSTNWTESGIAWNNRPPLGTALTSTNINGTAFNWYEIDVTSHVLAQLSAGSNVVSFALTNLTTSTLTTQINSREAATNRPSLSFTVTNFFPSVAVVSPANGTFFTPPANIPVTAFATTPAGTITRVEMFSGPASLGIVSNAPYSLVWSNVPSGIYSLTARATDSRGLMATSIVVTVIVDAPPSVNLTAPANGATFISPANITINASASDSDGSVTNVEFFQGTTSLGADAAAPYSVSWNSVAGGAYALTAKATDNQGRVSTSSVVNVTVSDPPSITTQPQSQTVLVGGSATFSVTATGTAPLSYQWRLNGTNLLGKTNPTLNLSNLQRADVGSYSVVVTNPYGSVASLPAALTLSVIVGWGGANSSGQTNIHSWMSNNIVAVSAGWSFNLALKSDGNVNGWGSNSYGQTNPPASVVDVVAVSGGESHGLALKSDGTVVGWGNNSQGQAVIPSGLTNIVSIDAGRLHSLALKGDGRVVAWGWNMFGQVNVPSGLSNVAAIASSGDHSVALRSNGTVVAWGWGQYGQTNVPAGLSNVVAVAAGEFHNLAIKNDGTVTGWGSTSNYNSLSIPTGLSNVVAIAAGNSHSLALKADGTVVKWGGDSFYQADGPVPANLSNVVAISAGTYHSIALLTNDGNLFPSISITSPANNTTNTGPTNVTISATAKDWDGSITNVEFYVNGSLIGTDASSPYSLVWSNVPLGSYILTARAIDNLGASKVSAPVTLRINSSVGGNEDAHVFDGQATSNFGAATNLEVRTSTAGNNRDAYLKFDLSNFTGITGARLRINGKLSGSGSVGVSAYVVTNTSWGESTITWNNRPAFSNVLGGATVASTSLAWYELDVTSQVLTEKAAGRNLITLGLHATVTSTRTFQINSFEASANKPELVLSSTNTAPTVTISDPTNSSVFAAPANIPIAASASDPDGSVAKVEFFSGTTSLGADTNAPFTLTWSNVTSGAYNLTARATDNLGTVRTSAVVTVVADKPPTVTLTSPTNNALFVEPANVSLAATASDSDGTVSKVEFYAGTNKVAEATNSPYTATWTAVPSGIYSLTARATDNFGISTVSSPVSITIFPTPTNAALMRLGYWRFDDTNWLGDQGQTPITATNIQNVSGTISNAVQVNSTNPALLKYREVEFNHAANIDVRNGTVVFWFKPAWSSTDAGGAGPGALGHLLGLGQLTGDASIGCWTLSVNAAGTALSFITQTNGAGTTNFTAAISWQSNQWHQIGLVYTASNSALFIDGLAMVTNGLGVTLYPDAVTRAADGFSIGSDRAGNAQGKGQFDALETFNYPLSGVEISQRPDSDGDRLPDGWETLYGLDPDDPTGSDGATGDPDEDGLLNIEEWLFGTNPNSNELPGGGTGAIRIHTPLE